MFFNKFLFCTFLFADVYDYVQCVYFLNIFIKSVMGCNCESLIVLRLSKLNINLYYSLNFYTLILE